MVLQERHQRGLREEGIDEGLGIEGEDVFDFFADAGKADRKAEFVGDGDHDAAFGGAVELGKDDAGDTGGFGEEPGLLQTVLAGGGIDDEQGLVRRAGHLALGRATHLVELFHEVGFRVEAAGGIDEHEVGLAGFGGGERVEKGGGRIAALLGLDKVDAGALRPDFELFDGGGAEGVGGAQEHASAFATVKRGEFAGGGGFAGAGDADHHDDLGRGGGAGDGDGDAVENAADFGFEETFELGAVGDAVAEGALAEAADDLIRGGGADIGGEQSKFEIVKGGFIDLAGKRDHRGDRGGERVPRARDRLPHAVEEAAAALGFRFRFGPCGRCGGWNRLRRLGRFLTFSKKGKGHRCFLFYGRDARALPCSLVILMVSVISGDADGDCYPARG